MPNNVIWGIRPDGDGRLWLSTNHGLSRFDPVKRSFKNYDASHGLQSNEFNFGAHFRSRTGELFFGGVNGFNAFHPGRLESVGEPPPVVLTEFSKIDRAVDLGRPIFDVDEIELTHRDYLFSFEFAALDYAAPEKNRYRYRLEGLDQGWIDLGRRRRVTFTDLDPGRYMLRVQGANHDGVWKEDGPALGITIRPPVWQTWWFRMAAAVVLIGALLGLHNRRMKKVRRRQQERAEVERGVERERLIAQLEGKNAELERFTYTGSHDLKGRLLTIRGFLGFLKRDAAEGKTEHVLRDVDRVDAVAEKMYRLLEDLLQLARLGHQVNPSQEVPFDDLVVEAVEMVDGEIRQRGVELVIAPDLPVVAGDRRRLIELLQHLLQNAVKYMGNQSSPKVEGDVRRLVGGGRVFYVRDNGIGIEPRFHDQVFGLFERLSADSEGTGVGLAVVKRIVELHGGRVWVESDGPGRGSTFCFTLERAPSVPG